MMGGAGVGQVEMAGPMHQVMLQSVDVYQPVFRGESLDIETGSSEVSLKNVRRLLREGLNICGLNAGPSGGVLVIFDSGETYWAKGFSVGERNEAALALAKVAYEAGLGSLRDWISYVTLGIPHGEGWQGPLMIPPPPGPGHKITLRPIG